MTQPQQLQKKHFTFNPNSANQRWSKWCWTVRPGRNNIVRPFSEVQTVIAKALRLRFQSVSQANIYERIVRGDLVYVIELLTEGHAVHDPALVAHERQKWELFFISGFGADTKVKMTAKLMAGSRQDGTPAEQLLIMPHVVDEEFAAAMAEQRLREQQQRLVH